LLEQQPVFGKDAVFTSCATEGNNTAIAAALKANPTKRHIVTSQVEHSSVLNFCMALERGGLDRSGGFTPRFPGGDSTSTTTKEVDS
jgi:cysteine sulfinate desulfinase/cysteine desulfurase-like protein